jgi:chitinase
MTLAFLETPYSGSCNVDWNGEPGLPVATFVYGQEIASIRHAGGNVAASFGGYGADHNGTDIADSCTNTKKVAAAYEHAITTYNLTRIDLDIEDRSLSNTAGVDRRNSAVRLVEQWAARQHREVQFVYTFPASASGLGADSVDALQNAASQHVTVTIVNMMTFDYGDTGDHDMATDTETAASQLHELLHQLGPKTPSARLWNMVGVTEMIGVDDNSTAQIFTLSDARTIESWAKRTGIGEISFWALQRDNGACPGLISMGNCSGVTQSQWEYSKELEAFTY